MQITAEEALNLVRGGATISEVEDTFTVAGAAQVAAVQAAPELEVNAELVTAVEVLLAEAHPPTRGRKNTKDGRTINTLTPYDGLGDYTIVIYAPKS